MLVNRLRALFAQGTIPTGCVYVQTAASEADFTDLQYEYSIRRVLAGIENIKKRGNKAKLLLVRRVLERKGGKPGPKRQEYASAWKIDTLRNLAKGARFEVAVTHPARKRALESARQEVWKYCKKFYRYCEMMGLHTPENWQRSAGDVSLLQFVFGFELSRDCDAMAEAYKRGKRASQGRLARRQVPRESSRSQR